VTTPQHARSAIGFGLALVALVVPVMLSAIVPNVGGPFVSFSPVTINATAGDQFDPHISGDWVSYTSDLEIRYYRFSTGTDAAIPMGASARDLLAGISGSKIVFSRVVTGVKTAVMVFDASTPLVPPIEIDAADAVTRIGSSIGGNTVAYIDFTLEAHGELVIHRSLGAARFPARFQLVLASNPCPCGRASGGAGPCR